MLDAYRHGDLVRTPTKHACAGHLKCIFCKLLALFSLLVFCSVRPNVETTMVLHSFFIVCDKTRFLCSFLKRFSCISQSFIYFVRMEIYETHTNLLHTNFNHIFFLLYFIISKFFFLYNRFFYYIFFLEYLKVRAGKNVMREI